jgi:steroid 5-alpha reductase family enzyme
VNPLDVVLVLAAAASLYCWVASLTSGDTSWVDRLWSILPVLYAWVFAWRAHGHDPALDLIAGLVTLWGVRLTFNFARKGGYSGVEDYRWAVLRARMSPARFQLFNLGFIVLVQNALLVAITLPAWRAYQHRRGARLGAGEAVLAALFLVSLVLEAVADEQQWRFQSAKRRALEAGRTPPADFLTTGLFAYARHPNYFFELAQWWLVYALGALAIGHALDWTLAGPVALTGLFVGSTRFTEEISLARYPEYRDYQARVGAIVPRPVRPTRLVEPAP